LGTVIVLNGASSAGKSSLLAEVQQALQAPFLDAGLDKFLWMLPAPYRRAPLWAEVMGKADAAGPVGHQLVKGMHRAIAALSQAGSHVIADHVLIEPAWLAHCAETLAGLPTLFVGVVCPLPVLVQREQARGDRTLGQAALQHALVHRGARYDLVIDTAQMSAAEGAAAIARHLAHVGPNPAFNTGPHRLDPRPDRPSRSFMRALLGSHNARPSSETRAVTPDDRAALGRLMLAAYAGTVDDDGGTLEQALEEVQKTLNGEYGAFDAACSRLIERQGRIVSATLLTRFQGRPFVAFSMTDPDFKNRGLGAECLRSALGALHSIGEWEVRLVVTLANAPAMALYAKLGFTAESAG
jgi:chloramphenicol 3-O phosphotransferase